MSGNIKGITIEIGGDTKPLQDALKGVNKEASEATKELKQIDRALKFDTGNITLLTQKQEVLGKQVETTKEKLATLREAQAQVEAQFKAGNIGADQYRAFQREVESTKTVLGSYESKLEGVTKSLEMHGSKVETNRTKLETLQKEAAQLASQSEKVTSAFKLQESVLGSNASESEKLALAQKRVEDESSILEKQIRNLEQQLELTKREFGDQSLEANKLEKSLNETKTSYNELQKEMEELATSSETVESCLEKTNQLLKSDILAEFGDKIGELSQKLIDLGKESLDAFLEVDEGLDIIVTKTGETGDALEGMTRIAKELATELPTDFKSAGSAVGELHTQFGLTGERLKEASRQLIQFSEINDSDVTTSALTSKKALEAYGLSVSDLTQVLDVVTYTSQATGVGVQDLLDKAVTGAPQIKALGLSFSEGVTLLGRFEQAGVDSSLALTSLSKAAVTYAKDGLTLKEGLAKTVEEIKATTSETKALSLASEVFGTKAAPRMVDAIKRGAFSFEELSTTAQKASGVVSTTFDATLDPIDQFTTAQNKATLVLAALGDVIASTLAPILNLLADLLEGLVTWFSGLAEPIQQCIVLIGLLVAGFGGLLPVFLTLQAAALAMGTSLVGLITVIAPLIGIILGVVSVLSLLVIGVKEAWEHHEGFRTAVMEIWRAISSFLSGILGEISNCIQSIWGTLVTWWEEHQELILSVTKVVWESLYSVIQMVMNLLGPLLQAGWEILSSLTSSAWETIKTVVETTMRLLLEVITFGMQVISGDWNGAWESLKNILGMALEGMKNLLSIALNLMANLISSIWNGILNTLSNILNSISALISSIWTGIQGTISSILEGITSSMSNGWNGIKSLISGVLEGIAQTVSSIWNGIKDTISGAINAAKEAVSSAINAIKNLFNFQIQWPHIPLPHFRVSGSPNPLDWLSGGLPHIAIDWYQKGGILTKPTVFGINGNRLMVGGEAGKEAVLPLNEATLSAIGRGIAKTMMTTMPSISITITGNTVRNELDLRKLAELVGEELLYELKRQQDLKGGRT